jgi:hypothetical protein
MRIRSIKPEFWTDPKLGRVSREARLLFIGSWNLSDDYGVCPADAAFLKGALFPFDADITEQTIETLLAELAQLDRIRFFEVEGERYFLIKNFRKHQFIDRPSKKRFAKAPAEILRGLDECSSRAHRVLDEGSIMDRDRDRDREEESGKKSARGKPISQNRESSALDPSPMIKEQPERVKALVADLIGKQKA